MCIIEKWDLFPFGGIVTEIYMKGMATGQYITFPKIKNIVREVFKNFLGPSLKINSYIILHVWLWKIQQCYLEVLWIWERSVAALLWLALGLGDSHSVFHDFGPITRFLWKISLTEVDLKSIVLCKLLSIVNKTINWYNFWYI